ncbi:MAG TPA: sugar phosphate isomerase/epimerase [Chitinophagaceae bacterium]|nr:sugar phosphate isomerase/epimerase [Chitinophagaceae bacterium]
MTSSFSRRQIIKTGFLAALSASVTSGSQAMELFNNDAGSDDEWMGFKMGIASYTFRKFSLEQTIKALQRLNLHYISIKDFHLALTSTTAERKAAIQKCKEAGITPLSCGNITMQNDENEIRKIFEYAKDCDLPTIVCSPHPDSMAILDKMVKEYDIKLAIHNHGPEDKRFPSPYDVYKAVEGFDKRIGLCIDVGHTARAKVNPAEAIIKCKDRLYDLHIKDINSTEANGATIEAGRGVIDLPSILKSLHKIKYNHLVSLEFEGQADDPLPAVAESIGYIKGVLAGDKKLHKK